jgi:hypothetical protein
VRKSRDFGGKCNTELWLYFANTATWAEEDKSQKLGTYCLVLEREEQRKLHENVQVIGNDVIIYEECIVNMIWGVLLIVFNKHECTV